MLAGRLTQCYCTAMVKALEAAIERVKRLPAEQQAYAVHVLEQLALDCDTPFDVPLDHRSAILEGLEQAHRGEFASDEDIAGLLRKPWA